MKFPFYIAKRYLFSKSNTNAINIITFIAMFGVIVGSLALFVILSGFSGLRTFSDSLLEASDPDLRITAKEGKSFQFSDSIKNILSYKEIAAASAVVEERIFIRYKDKQEIAYIKGVDTFYNEVVPIDSSLTVGNWLDKKYTNTAVVGYGISYKLSIGIYNFGEPLELYAPKKGLAITPTSIFTSEDVQIVGVYSGSEDFQNKYVFTNIELAQKLLNYKPEQVSAIEVKLSNTNLVDQVKENLSDKLGVDYQIKTRAEQNALYYKVVNTENFISYLIFTLIIIIALFNVIGSIIMMIIDKKDNLKTLYNLGANINEIKRVFILQGFMLSLVGMCVGITIGVILVLVQQRYGLFMITDSLAYPVEFRWMNLAIVIFTISILGYLAAKIASSRINTSFLK